MPIRQPPSRPLPGQGWYREPATGATRWWNGREWGDYAQRPGANDFSNSPQPPVGLLIVTYICIGALVAGSMLPWVRVLIITVNGTDTAHGVATLILGVVAAGLLAGWHARRRVDWALLLVGLISCGVAASILVYDYFDVLSSVTDASTADTVRLNLTVQLMFGFYLATGGAICATVLCGLLMTGRHASRSSVTAGSLATFGMLATVLASGIVSYVKNSDGGSTTQKTATSAAAPCTISAAADQMTLQGAEQEQKLVSIKCLGEWAWGQLSYTNAEGTSARVALFRGVGDKWLVVETGEDICLARHGVPEDVAAELAPSVHC